MKTNSVIYKFITNFFNDFLKIDSILAFSLALILNLILYKNLKKGIIFSVLFVVLFLFILNLFQLLS